MVLAPDASEAHFWPVSAHEFALRMWGKKRGKSVNTINCHGHIYEFLYVLCIDWLID